MLFLHFHGSGGTSVCDFAKRAASMENGTHPSGVRLSRYQWWWLSNCNLRGWSPYSSYVGEEPRRELRRCSGLLDYARRERTTWVHLEAEGVHVAVFGCTGGRAIGRVRPAAFEAFRFGQMLLCRPRGVGVSLRPKCQVATFQGSGYVL